MNIPQAKRYTTMLGGRELILETGKLAKQVSGSIVVRYGDTMLLVTAQMGNDPVSGDFLPLTVEYEERHYAIGKIPGSYQRREGRPGIQATLNARIVDRQIRPLFPKGFRHEIQVIVTVLSADQKNPPGALAAIGASAALSISNIPWDGPTACVSVGYIDGAYLLNPTLQQEEMSRLELTIAASKDAVLMVEAGADELDEQTMIGAIEFAQHEMQGVLKLIEQMRAEVGEEKVEFEQGTDIPAETVSNMLTRAKARGLREALLTTGKHQRKEGLKALRDGIIEELVPDPEAEEAKDRISELKEAFSKAEQEELRRMVLEESLRCDGRGPADIRPIWTEVGTLPRAHGSAVFTRGETQALAVTTLGTGRDNMLIDDLTLDETAEFMLHYNFPPYSTGEVKRLRGVSRRELGHGNLARRALERMLPEQEAFPYVIRIVSEVLESNGSSSMASVCGGSLALMDAGVPVKKAVAGIAMGLVMEEGSYKVLSDILGSEDALGDMDFKVTGTRQGITALQMDIKIKGITPQIMQEALEQARQGRVHILDLMQQTLATPRKEINSLAPRILSLEIAADKIGSVIGPGGKHVRELEALGATVEIKEEGTKGFVRIYSEDAGAAAEVKKRIEAMTATLEAGQIYEGTVVKIVEFGAFISLVPGTDGLLHISQIAEGHVNRVEDHLQVGDSVRVKINTLEDRGGKPQIDLVRPELEGIVPPRSGRRGGGGGGRRGGGGGGRRY